MLKGKRVFISGGNGVIGNALVDMLYEQGAIIYVGDLKPRPLNWAKDIIYRQGDLNYITKEELDNFNPEYFFHLAATFERSSETYEFWEENYSHNVHLSHHLMSLLKDSDQLKKVIFASSYLIYDPKLYCFDKPAEKAYRLKENDPIYPRNLTGVAKLNHEIELRFLEGFKHDKYQTISARIYRSYGKNSRDIISRWIRSLLNNETLAVFKKEGLFDYIFADDVAEGLVRLANHPTAKGIYNLGNDNARKVEEVLSILKMHFPNLKYIEQNSDIAFEGSQANMDYYNKTIGWKPQQQLETTIPKIIEYEKNKKSETSDNEKVGVLVTSISKKIGLLKAVKKACNKLGSNTILIGGDVNKNAIGKYFVDVFWEMPPIKELNAANVITYCKTNQIKLIIPSRDGELPFWSSIKKELLSNGIHIMVSNSDSIDICIDKLKFFETLNKLNIPAITTTTTIDTLKNANTYVVKEQFGAGSLSIGLNLSKEQAIEHAKKLEHPIFQPYIIGKEISIDVYIDNTGKAKGSIARSRDLVVNGESQITTTIYDLKLEQLSVNLVEKIKLSGHIVLQVLLDEKKNIHIIECNSRFGGASTLSVHCGLDSFYWALLEASGNDISEYPFIQPKKQKSQIRFPEDIIVD
ncbi:MAG: NAD-dependent epimerase/dehydratase family protein [Bacteroidota bacterium]